MSEVEAYSRISSTYLVQVDLDRVHQAHCVLEVQVGLSITTKAQRDSADKAAINRLKIGCGLPLLRLISLEEEVEITLKVALRCVLDNAKRVGLQIGGGHRDLVESTKTLWSDIRRAVLEALSKLSGAGESSSLMCNGTELGGECTGSRTFAELRTV
jgi:hypothetical protein